ncbi:MAG: amino acid adenylation domain-containing protein [Arcicella sp.]|jgi:amino acid adenylation domain-containing protein|nr:amino acid adenylation domain-containing protein [Arcicella sp.]
MFTKEQIKDIYPLNPMQEGMLFHALKDKTSSAYFMQSSYFLTGNFSEQLAEKSLQTLIDHYDVLRTAFLTEGLSRPFQVVLHHRKADFNFYDVSNLPTIHERLMASQTIKEQDLNRSFDFVQDVLIRISVIKIEEQKFEVVWSNHHILMDGWCNSILIKEFMYIYQCFQRDEIPTLNPAEPYKNYIKWIEKQNTQDGLSYWKNYLAGYEGKAEIPGKTLNQKIQSVPNVGQELLSFDGKMTELILQYAKKNQVSISILLQAIWGILLTKYNNTKEVVVGTVLSGRPPEIKGIETMIGLFINTVPIKISYDSTSSVSEVLLKLRTDIAQSNRFQYFNLADIQANSSQKQDLINHIFVSGNQGLSANLNQLAINEHPTKETFVLSDVSGIEQTHYDFCVYIHTDNHISISFDYNPNVYERSAVQMIVRHFEYLTNQIILQDSTIVNNLEILSGDEKNDLLKMGQSPIHLTNNVSIVEHFEYQVKKNPLKTALIYQNNAWSYKALAEEVNQFSRHLHTVVGVKKQNIIAVCTERSIHSMIGLLAVLKTGNIYLPIDPTHPNDRRVHILAENNVQYVITQEKFNHLFEDSDYQVINIDTDCKSNDLATTFFPNQTTISDTAYIIYTSGSTGVPKGIPIRHESIANRIEYHNKYLSIKQEDNILHISSLNFDASLVEIFMALTSGATLTIAEEMIKNSLPLLTSLLEEKKVTVAILTPAFIKILERNPLPSLETIVTTGEAAILSESLFYAKTKKVVNGYGPTETCIGATFHTVDPQHTDEYLSKGAIPIGLPFADTNLYLLNENNELVPRGMIGEICISGIGLTKGYINNIDLTNEKIIHNPFSQQSDDKFLYKTGDLGMWNLTYNHLEYVGRKDSQVQIRGIRVELAEIENCLLQHNSIKDAKVIARQNNSEDTIIVAFIIENFAVDESEIFNFLSDHLPAYMLPYQLVKLEHLPTTSNGKVDIKALSQLTISLRKSTKYLGPRNKIENELTLLWQEILKIDLVGVLDNFFEVGGHSLHAIKLVSRLYKVLNVKLEVKDIFSYPTIEQLAIYIKEQSKTQFSKIKPIAEQELYPLSHAQWRMFVMEQIGEGKGAYNISQAFRVHGNLNIDAFENALNTFVERHESMRTRFVIIDDEPFQQIVDFSEISSILRVRQLLENEILDEVISSDSALSFDLTAGVLVRVNLYKISENEHILLLTMHHIVSDAWSGEILMKEVIQLYNAYQQGKENPLEKLKIQYKDYVFWQKEQFTSDWKNEAKSFWLNHFSGDIPVLELPTSSKRPNTKSYKGKTIVQSISPEIQNQLSEIAKKHNTSMFMILSAVVNVLLYRYSGQTDIIIGTPVAGRNHADLENQVGIFINTLAVRNQINSDEPFAYFLNRFTQNTLAAFAFQDYPFDQLVEDLGIERDASRTPLFDIMVSFQNVDNKQTYTSSEITFEGIFVENQTSKFDLDFTFSESENSLELSLEYNTDIFSIGFMEKLCSHFNTLLCSITNDLATPIHKLKLLSTQEIDELTLQVNTTFQDFPEHLTFVDLFESQVEKTPKEVAIVFEKNTITYKSLNEKSNQIARFLLDNFQIKKGDLVGIIMNRSERMFEAILGILKAGAAYVPIDPEYPQERIHFLIEDSNTKIILTDIPLENIIDSSLTPVINLINDFQRIEQYGTTNLGISICSTQLAYVIYTSGSTGKPKGVMVEHGNLSNIAHAWNRQYQLSTFKVKLLQIASISFDVFVGDMCRALLNGGTLVVCPTDIRVEADNLYNLIYEHQINILESTPTVILPLMKYIWEQKLPYSWIKILILGADICPKQDFKDLLIQFSHSMRILNSYGTTETTIDSSFYETNPDLLYEGFNVPIGKPMDNYQYYVLDGKQNLVPKGSIGELYIGGKSVARGYLNRPELSQERFMNNPFMKSTRLYRTGDLVRWLPDNNIELMGRVDNQVKVRGYRIELGEIETALRLFSSEILQVMVSIKKNTFGEDCLVAYIQPLALMPTSQELRDYLRTKLPEYMIPSFFLEVKEWLLTPNGKLDRKNLPNIKSPEIDFIKLLLPETETEKQIASIVQEVLGIDTIGIDHNFFELGCNSLKAMKILSKIRKSSLPTIKLQDVFLYPSIRELANRMDKDVELNDYEIKNRVEFYQQKIFNDLQSESETQKHTCQKIYSNILDENYTLFIKTPEGYDSRNQYPVLYILDADEYFEIAIESLEILQKEQGIQLPIVVGISEGGKQGSTLNKRERDFTPTKSNTIGLTGTGGAANFLAFFEHELIPFIEQKYYTNKHKTLFGYSYGGLFCAYAISKKIHLFQKVIMGSSSLMYDEEVIFSLDDAEINLDFVGLDIIMIAGSLEQEVMRLNKRFAEKLQNIYRPNLTLEHIILDNQTHFSGQIETMISGLKAAFLAEHVF